MSVKIMKEISKLNATAKFVFVGDGELRPQVEQKIKEYNLEDRIVLLGARDDANKWYSAIDCLIMPSLFGRTSIYFSRGTSSRIILCGIKHRIW